MRCAFPRPRPKHFRLAARRAPTNACNLPTLVLAPRELEHMPILWLLRESPREVAFSLGLTCGQSLIDLVSDFFFYFFRRWCLASRAPLVHDPGMRIRFQRPSLASRDPNGRSNGTCLILNIWNADRFGEMDRDWQWYPIVFVVNYMADVHDWIDISSKCEVFANLHRIDISSKCEVFANLRTLRIGS